MKKVSLLLTMVLLLFFAQGCLEDETGKITIQVHNNTSYAITGVYFDGESYPNVSPNSYGPWKTYYSGVWTVQYFWNNNYYQSEYNATDGKFLIEYTGGYTFSSVEQ